jgi:DNA end-binding protein Ku
MPHASWKGFLRLSLVSVPVQAFNAETPDRAAVSFNQLHDKCKSRIKYVKTCPVHGEVANNEIVKGYEYTKGEYVIVEDEELDTLRGKPDPAVEIDTFVKPGSIDPKYFDGSTYYLMPDGPLAKKPYAVLLEVLAAKGLWGIATANIAKRNRIGVLRTLDGALSLETLHYHGELRGPAEIWENLELPKVEREEVRLASTLIDASTTKAVDLRKYHDDYNEKVRALLEAKVEGREIVAPPQPAERAPVINLMDALKKSIASTQRLATARRVAQASLSRAARPRKAGKRKSAG